MIAAELYSDTAVQITQIVCLTLILCTAVMFIGDIIRSVFNDKLILKMEELHMDHTYTQDFPCFSCAFEKPCLESGEDGWPTGPCLTCDDEADHWMSLESRACVNCLVREERGDTNAVPYNCYNCVDQSNWEPSKALLKPFEVEPPVEAKNPCT